MRIVGYGPDLVAEVAEELSSSLKLADDALIPRSGYNIHTHTPSYIICMYLFQVYLYVWIRWNQIVDPGIGFAKGLQENTLLLQPQNIARLKNLLGQRTMLIGLSRKRFLSRIMDENGHKIGPGNYYQG